MLAVGIAMALTIAASTAPRNWAAAAQRQHHRPVPDRSGRMGPAVLAAPGPGHQRPRVRDHRRVRHGRASPETSRRRHARRGVLDHRPRGARPRCGPRPRWAAGSSFSLSETLRTGLRPRRMDLPLAGPPATSRGAGMPSSRRHGAPLLWRELRSVVPFVPGFSCSIPDGRGRCAGGGTLQRALLLLVPIACGFMAGGSDQGRHTFRFPDRLGGISPYRI